jgi:hypothetical protein
VIDGTFETPHVAVLEIKNVGKFKDPVAMMLFAELKDPVRVNGVGLWLFA